MQASLDLADRGYKVYLVEKTPSIGGKMALLDKTFPTMDCAVCILAPKMIECYRNPNIELLTYCELREVSGSAGDFTVTVLKKPKFVDEELCTGCDDCTEVCPVLLPNEFESGIGTRKAIYRPYLHAVPNIFTIDKRGIPPCRAACPAGVNVQGYVALIKEGKFEEALELIRRDIPFPAVCGRVCFHPCETECEREKVDEPIAINALKRFVSDYEAEKGREKVEPIPKTHEEKIAVIGSGPSGLTAARELVKCGYPVTVFESMPEPGGMLRYGIPSYRLPKDVLNIEIERIKDLGVEIKTNTVIGKDLAINELLQKGYKAIFIAVGAQKGRKLNIENEELEGIVQALGFLKEVNMGKEVRLEGKVAVIGGGNVAVDAARSALRVGSEDAYILYRRTREEMPAYLEDVEKAEKEGVKLRFLVTPKKFLGEEGRVTGIECIRMKLGEPDESGRRRPIPVEGSEFIMEINIVILAIGQTPDFPSIPEWIEVTKTNTIVTDKVTLETSHPSIFAGGDIVRGPATVIEAIADGKRAAESIDRYLRGEDLRKGREEVIEKVEEVPKEGVTIQSRQKVPVLPLDQRIGNFREIDLGFSEEMAKKEAGRCLSCGGCSECLECEKVCEAKAIIHQQKEEYIQLNVDAIIVATGLTPFDPSEIKEYGYGRHKDVITALELEHLVTATGPTKVELIRLSNHEHPKKIAFIQCVGSRSLVEGYPYCSAVCCMHATKEALLVKEHEAEADVSIFYTDLRAFGKGFKEFTNRARDEYGVRYIRAKPSEIREDPETGKLTFWYEDTMTGEMNESSFDLVVLCTALIPDGGNFELAKILDVEVDEYGFFVQPNPIQSPLDTTRRGIFVCGFCQGPKDIPDTIAEASGAAARAAEIVESPVLGMKSD